MQNFTVFFQYGGQNSRFFPPFIVAIRALSKRTTAHTDFITKYLVNIFASSCRCCCCHCRHVRCPPAVPAKDPWGPLPSPVFHAEPPPGKSWVGGHGVPCFWSAFRCGFSFVILLGRVCVFRFTRKGSHTKYDGSININSSNMYWICVFIVCSWRFGVSI